MDRRNNGYAARIMAAALATALLALAGCADTTEQAKPEEEPTDLVWPLPPEQPRIRYVRSIRSNEDIGATDEVDVTSTLLGSKEKETEQRLRKPYGVHADRNGRIFVADTALGKLVMFDVTNKKFEIWGESGKGSLKKPLGITTDSQGRVYVTDGTELRVVVFDRAGNFLFAAGKQGELTRPVGVAVNETLGHIYVADSQQHHIAVFDMAAGNLISTIGERGIEPGQFNFPTNLAIDREGKLYVVDTMNFRVQILDPAGNPLKAIGRVGDSPGSFSRPKGIAVDSDGHIYVVDAAFNNFQIFDSEGALLLFVGNSGREPGQFSMPAGAYIDAQDRLYVVDQFNSRVQVFQYLAKPVEQAAPESAPVENSTESPQQ
jgi:DNA-binding beta-propeller fold protein YncE